MKDKDGRWWVGRGNLGSIRGGQAVCLPYNPNRDRKSWYLWYNQINEGKCVGEAGSRAMSHLNRRMYNPTWLWNEAKKIDEWTETNPGDNNGTSVRAAMDVLRNQGHVRKRAKQPSVVEGIAANRWATNIDDLFTVLQNDEYKKLGAIPFHNSWGEYDPTTGEGYPQTVWVPCEIWDRLMKEQGEFTMITDK